MVLIRVLGKTTLGNDGMNLGVHGRKATRGGQATVVGPATRSKLAATTDMLMLKTRVVARLLVGRHVKSFSLAASRVRFRC